MWINLSKGLELWFILGMIIRFLVLYVRLNDLMAIKHRI